MRRWPAIRPQARRVLEIGTLGGYSTICIARALPEDGEIVTIEADVHHAGVAERNISRANLGAGTDFRWQLSGNNAAGTAAFQTMAVALL